MTFNFQEYNQNWIENANANNPPINDAKDYGIEIYQAKASEAYRVLGVHHLTNDENGFNHHLYVDVLNENGHRIQGKRVQFTAHPNGDVREAVIDKPSNEPGTNIPIWPNDTVTVYVKSANYVTDSVTGIHVRHPDEGEHNRLYHHSFYVCFQLRTGEVIDPPPPVEDTHLIEVITITKHNGVIVREISMEYEVKC